MPTESFSMLTSKTRVMRRKRALRRFFPLSGRSRPESSIVLGRSLIQSLPATPHHRRKSMWLGAILCCGTLFGASYATEIFQLVLLQGVLYAIGGSLLYLPCVSFMSEWFVARRGMANGILFAGTAAGGLLLPLALPPLISKYGSSKTLRILGIAITILLFPLLPFVKAASVIGRLSMGYLSDRFNPWILALTTLFTSSVATFILWGVLSHSFGGLLAFGIAYGSIAGGWSSLWTGFVRPLANDDPAMSTMLYGYLLLSRGIGNIVSTPISAKLSSQPHNVTGSPENTGFDVGDGRFEKMIIYVGTCFAGAAGVAALGWAMDARKSRQTGNQN
ncbi:MFS general substrate transporter [Mycena venus]|uniref:MFS general substrate transporter n=1 Tax=Mycena venus TaxID=2733690 RepID=A0A8H6YU33_9AGAR|nr:MFS general substrate transporter [Mycena venus]